MHAPRHVHDTVAIDGDTADVVRVVDVVGGELGWKETPSVGADLPTFLSQYARTRIGQQAGQAG